MPGLYHKSFMYVSAAIYALTGGVKAAVVGALLFFSIVGFLGAAFAIMAAFGRSSWPAGLLAGALLLTSNYATTDWLVRGAFAEYSAVAAISLLLVPLVHFVRGGHWSKWIGVCIAFLVVSHAGLALFVPPLVVVALIVAQRVHVLHWRSLLRRIAQSAVLTLALVAPFLMPLIAFSGYNDNRGLLSEGLLPASNFISPVKYIWDAEWRWGAHADSFTVQFDLYVLPVLIACIALLVVLKKKAPDASDSPRPGHRPVDATRAVLLFLTISFCVYFFLQMPFAWPIYELVPGARYIQLPWRLQAYTTVLAALMAAVLTVSLWRTRRRAGYISDCGSGGNVGAGFARQQPGGKRDPICSYFRHARLPAGGNGLSGRWRVRAPASSRNRSAAICAFGRVVCDAAGWWLPGGGRWPSALRRSESARLHRIL
ncbi:hypothetical protein CO641_14080 [Lysobacteraceae bacterium NML91-0213]|nr:hypothetical protein CO641_14080 [Xanthomonadaceae bacterium NML91-0213]